MVQVSLVSIMLREADFYYMIEITTGVVFLMSSLYGAGNSDQKLATVAEAPIASEQTISVTNEKGKDELSKNDAMNEVEAYVRKEYADTPILIEIARCESRFHQFNEDGTVIRGIANKKDVGIMQINEYYHAKTASKMGIDIYSMEGNVAFGKYLYDKYGTDPWTYSSKCWGNEIVAKGK